MIWLIPFILSVTALHRIRGSEWGRPFLAKGVTSALTGILSGVYSLWAGYSLTHTCFIALIIGAGIYLGVGKGWGEYFDGSDKPNNEIKIIDWIVSKVCLPSLGADILAMSIRHLFFAPILIALSFVAWNYSYALVPTLLAAGPLYFIPGIPEKHRIEAAEIAVGFIIALTLSTSLYLGLPNAAQ